MVVAQYDIRNRKRADFVQTCGDMRRTLAAHGRLVEHKSKWPVEVCEWLGTSDALPQCLPSSALPG